MSDDGFDYSVWVRNFPEHAPTLSRKELLAAIAMHSLADRYKRTLEEAPDRSGYEWDSNASEIAVCAVDLATSLIAVLDEGKNNE